MQSRAERGLNFDLDVDEPNADRLFSSNLLAASSRPDVKNSDQSESPPADSSKSQTRLAGTGKPPKKNRKLRAEAQIVVEPQAAVVLSHSVLPSDDLTYVSIQAIKTPGENIIIKYDGLAGNLPQTYSNNVALWGSLIPNLAVKPLVVTPLQSDDLPNDVVIPYELMNKNYCVTYQVGSDVKTMCALAQLKAVAGTRTVSKQAVFAVINIPQYVNIAIDQVTTNSLRVFYSTLPGYLPKTYRNWVGLWQGYASPYSGSQPLGMAQIDNDSSEDFVTINNVSISSMFTYTLVYFTGPTMTNAASLLYFQTGPSQS